MNWSLNASQRRVLGCGMLLFFLIALFPPWLISLDAGSQNTAWDYGRRFFLTGHILDETSLERVPRANSLKQARNLMSTGIDFGRLLAQQSTIVILTLGGIWLTAPRRRDQKERSETSDSYSP